MSSEIVAIDTFGAWEHTVKRGIQEGVVDGLYSLREEKWFVRRSDGWAYVDHARDKDSAKVSSLAEAVEQIDMKLDRVLELLCDDDDMEDADE